MTRWYRWNPEARMHVARMTVRWVVVMGAFALTALANYQTVAASSPPPVSTLNCYLVGQQQSCPSASDATLQAAPTPGVVNYPEHFTATVDACVYTEPPVNGNNQIALTTCTNPGANPPTNGTNALIKWIPQTVVVEFYYGSNNPDQVCQYVSTSTADQTINLPYDPTTSPANGTKQPCIKYTSLGSYSGTPPVYTFTSIHQYATASTYQPAVVVEWNGAQPYTTYVAQTYSVHYDCGNPASVLAGNLVNCNQYQAQYTTQQPQGWWAGNTNDQTQYFTQYYVGNSSQAYTSENVYAAGWFPALSSGQSTWAGCCGYDGYYGSAYDEFNGCNNVGVSWNWETWAGTYVWPDYNSWSGCIGIDNDDAYTTGYSSLTQAYGGGVTTFPSGIWYPYLTSSPVTRYVDQQYVASYTASYHTSQYYWQLVYEYVPVQNVYYYYQINTAPNNSVQTTTVVDTCAQAGGCQYNYNVPPPYFQYYTINDTLSQPVFQTSSSWSQDPAWKTDYTQWLSYAVGSYTDYWYSYNWAYQAYPTGWNSRSIYACSFTGWTNLDLDGDSDMGYSWNNNCWYQQPLGWESYAGYPAYIFATPHGYTNYYGYWNVNTWWYGYVGWNWQLHYYTTVSYTNVTYQELDGAWHDWPWTTVSVSYNAVNPVTLQVKQIEGSKS